MATSNLLSRVLLPKKDNPVTEETFVPGGSPVPAQYKIPLLNKLPMFPAPTGALELYTSKLGQLAYINTKRYGFDLYDPYNHTLDWSYKSEQDPHMQHVIKTPAWRQKLKALGQLTEHDRVHVTLKEFNQFRRFLKHKSLNELRSQLAEERRRCPKIEVGDSLEVVAIETRVHAQEVQSRRIQTEEETHEKFKTLVTQTEHKVKVAKRKRDIEQKHVTSRKNAEQKKHREDVYLKAMKIVRQRAHNVLKAWKKKMRDYIEHMRQVEAQRVDDREAKLEEKWTLRRQNQLAYEELLDASREADKARRERNLRLLDAEMTRRWQAQAGKLQMIKDVSRQVQGQREEAYARNLMRAFARSRLLNPEGSFGEDSQLAKKGGDEIHSDEKLGDKLTVKRSKSDSKSSSRHSKYDLEDEAGLPHFKTIFTKPVQRSHWVLEKEVKKMAINPRLHPFGGGVSDKELAMRKSEYDAARAACSGATIESLVLGKWKKRKGKLKKSYPTSVEPVEGTSLTGEEICVFKTREDIVNETPEVKREIKVAEYDENEESDEEEGSEEEREGGSSSSSSARASCIVPGLTGEDAEMMEGLLAKLLEDLRNGRVDNVDLLQLSALCNGMSSRLRLEETTSTTSLIVHEIVNHSMARLGEDIIMGRLSPEDLLAIAANLRATDSDASSVASGRLEQLVCETMDRASASMEADDEGFYQHFLEETLKTTVTNLRLDIERGNLSRMNVQEIGSALALAVMGATESDESLMADDTLVTTLQQLQQDIDAGQIEERVLDKALASLVSAYAQVTRGRSNLEVIKDFVLYVLLRTKQDLCDKNLDKDAFFKELQAAKIDSGNYVMELPDLAELEEAASKAIGKFKGLAKPDQAVADLIKTILGTGRRIMPGIARSRVPRISQSMIEQAGDSDCQLEIVLDLTAGVCTSFTRHMNDDSSFALVAENILGARFLIMIFSHWCQLDQDLPKETVAVQTNTEELAHVTCVRASLAENVVVVCFSWLWQDAVQDQLPVSIMPHVALDAAEFPNTTPLLDRLRSLGSYEDKIELVDDAVLKKVRKLGQELQEGGLGFDEAKALLTICLHVYLSEVVYCECSTEIKVDGTEPPGMISNVQFLISTCARTVLEHIQNRVARRLSALGHTAVELSFVTEILQDTAHDALGALSTFVTNDATAADDELSLLEPIILTTHGDMNPTRKQDRGPKAFLKRLVGMAKRASARPLKHSDEHTKDRGFKIVTALIRREIWRLAKEVVHLFNGLASLHNLLPPKMSCQKSPASDSVTSFLVSLLLELRRALAEDALPVDVAFDFIKNIADDKCPDVARDSPGVLADVVVDLVKDIELKQSASPCYLRLVQRLSRISLERRKDENVAEGMAAIAQVLSKADQAVLSTFLQTTLLSLLRSVRALLSGEDRGKTSEQEFITVAPSVDSFPEEAHEDQVPTKELITEAKIIVHVGLQKTLEKLGASPLPTDYPSDTSQAIVHDFVSQIQDSKAQTSEGLIVDNSLATYAQGLASEISHQLQDEANAGSSLSNRSIANIIIANTLKSINAGIKSGKIQLSVSPHESSADLTVPESAMSQRLSFCVCTTLKAVKSELNLLQLLENGGLVQDDTALGGDESNEAIEKARRIVDFLIKRVESDVEEARVEFQLTPDNQLAIVQLSPSASQTTKRVTSDTSNNFWSGSPTTMAIFILNTFRDVLTELRARNEFFDPRKTLPTTDSRRDTPVIPGLPFLMDDFILSNLLEVVSTMTAVAADPAKAAPKLSKEAAVVAKTFHAVVEHMKDEEMGSQAEDAETREMITRRRLVLGALDKVLRAHFLSDPLACFGEEPDFRTASSSEPRATSSGTEAVGGQLAGVLGVMQKIMASVHQTSAGTTGTSTALMLPAPGDSNVLGDVIVQAIQQMALYIREGRVHDQDLARLCRTFGSDLGEDASTKDKQAKALEDLDSLVVDVRQGRIPRNKLQQAAQQLSIRVLEKESRASSSPGDLVASPQASVSSQSVTISLSTQELLKQAVSGLMTELMDKGEISTKGSKDVIEESSAVSSRKVSIDVEAKLEDTAHEPLEDGEEGVEKNVPLRSRRMSVHDRTVSKTNVRDSTENRIEKASFSRVYSITEPTLTLAEACLEEESRELDLEAESPSDNSLSQTEGQNHEVCGAGTEDPTGHNQFPQATDSSPCEEDPPRTPISDRHCTSEPTLIEQTSASGNLDCVVEVAADEADDTESQLSAEPPDTGREEAEENTNASSVADCTCTETEGSAAQDWNASAVTSFGPEPLASTENQAKSSSSSFPEPGKQEHQKTPVKKTRKRKKKSTKAGSLSNSRPSIEELISPLEKWKKLINEISKRREGEDSNYFSENDFPQSTSQERKALKKKKKRLRKRSVSKVGKATTAYTLEAGGSQVDELAQTASDPLPAKGKVGARQSASSSARKVRRWSQGTLRVSRAANSEPQFDPFFPEDAPAEVSSYFGRHRLQRRSGTSSRTGPSGSYTSSKLTHISPKVSGGGSEPNDSQTSPKLTHTSPKVSSGLSGPSDSQTISRVTHLKPKVSSGRTGPSDSHTGSKLTRISPKVSSGGSGPNDSRTSSKLTHISPKVSTDGSLMKPKIMKSKGRKKSQDKVKPRKSEMGPTQVEFTTVTPLPRATTRVPKCLSAPATSVPAPEVLKTDGESAGQKTVEDSPYTSDRKSFLSIVLNPKKMSRADIEDWLQGQQKKQGSATAEPKEGMQTQPRALRKAASSSAKLERSAFARPGGALSSLSPGTAGGQPRNRQQKPPRPEKKLLQQQVQQHLQVFRLPHPPTLSLPGATAAEPPQLPVPHPPPSQLPLPQPPLPSPSQAFAKFTPPPPVDRIAAEKARPRLPTQVRPLGMTRSLRQKKELPSFAKDELAQQRNRDNSLV